MKPNDLLKLIKYIRKISLENFENLVNLKDTKPIMIIFNVKTLHSRIISNWGRDEDNDLHLGIDKEGWIIYTHTIAYGAGEPKISNKNITRKDDNYIYEYLNSEGCTPKKYLEFMSKCLEIVEKTIGIFGEINL